MFPGSVSKVSQYLSCFLIWGLVLSLHEQCAALVVERSDDRSLDHSTGENSAALIPRIPEEVVPRAPIVNWISPLMQTWDKVWTGQTSSQVGNAAWSKVVAEAAYNAMKPEGGTNLIVALCLPGTGNHCFVASIPQNEQQQCIDFIEDQINDCPQWKQVLSGSTSFHAEDLAIALAVSLGHKFPIASENKPFLSVYGLYTGTTTDWVGAPGPRWPCKKLQTYEQGRQVVCTTVLGNLDIGFLAYPEV
ncbi:hypothetical protein G7Y89_g2344 [Cudoniella acicularis]|uniref:Uncharacterized protein n=1 Tax=Cudoniella acicularis TaxID=354080 RepID=A0A8H4W8Q1_9HELO|nr:hypothetical protein G7Y89_g2344 [Cudoniella acicularis]